MTYGRDRDDELGDYRLVRLGPRRTRLDMVFKQKYKIRSAASKVEDLRDMNELWDKYVALWRETTEGASV